MYEELIQRLRANDRKSGWSDIDKMMDEAASALEDLDAQLDILVKADSDAQEYIAPQFSALAEARKKQMRRRFR